MSVVWFAIVTGVFMLLQMEFFSIFGLKKIDYRRFFSKENVYEGEEVEMVEILSNNKPVPLPWFKVESRISRFLRFRSQQDTDISYDQFHKSFFFLRGYKRITRRHHISCTHRGYYVLGDAAISAGDLFGLLNRFREIPSRAELYVYPRPLANFDLSATTLKWQGDIVMRRWIMPDPILVNGIREYRHGDSQKDIHWRATARTGELQVMTRDFTVSPRILLALNCQIREDMRDYTMDFAECEVIEHGLRIAAHLATWAISSGLEAGLCSNGRVTGTEGSVMLPPACSQSHLEDLLQAMAMLEIRRERNFYTMLDYVYDSGLTGVDILCVTPYWSERLESMAAKLRSLGNNVSHILYSREDAERFAAGFAGEEAAV